MAENLLIRNLDSETVVILNFAKKKFNITTNTKATFKIFNEFIRLEEENKKLKKKIEQQEYELYNVQNKINTLKEAFKLLNE